MLSFNNKQSFYKTKNKIDYILTIQAYRIENKIIDNETLQRLKDKETKGKLRFVSPFHYELRTEEKRQGVPKGDTKRSSPETKQEHCYTVVQMME